MTEGSIQLSLAILKTRLNRLQCDTSLDETALLPRLHGAIDVLKENGIKLTDGYGDIVLLADYAAWRYENRDSPTDMPPWLRLLRRERFLHTGGGRRDS